MFHNSPQIKRLKTNWVEISIAIFGLIFMHAILWYDDAFSQSSKIDPATAGQFGDFVGGYIGTWFALISVLLLVISLKQQLIAWQVDGFETKYFDLIKLHRHNVAEMELPGASGRKVFVLLLRELRLILELIRPLADDFEPALNQRQILHLAYYCLFFGTGPNSSRMLKKSLAEFNPDFIMEVILALSDPERKKRAKIARSFGYTPFEGHQSRLGHYYRHLFQTVSFVDKSKLLIEKYDFVKTLRAQLSTHEQAMLLVNSLCPLGDTWWKTGYIDTYKMVKNVPNEFFTFDELDMTSLFEDGYFEWQTSPNDS
jgi:hypothetical protein